MTKTLLTIGTLAALLLSACGGQNETKPAESAPAPATTSEAPAGSAKAAVEERDRLMDIFKESAGIMGKMIKGETAYDAAAFQAAADTLAENADKPWQHYTQESAKEESDAKPEVWSKPDQFKQEADKFIAAAAALKTAAAEGNLDAVKRPFGDVGQSCKSCHDSFRVDD
ncbi:c-type cytochrome [Neisseria weixii]|uniref:Cytochrome c n=1 Tax=Neisseria weixii TaxID=1853276 RepID=A0A3N4MW08_9NEIS|nr:cytochrome c [Neisseria weixii]ATD64280.1 cytochrome C [Neisseria weixii]RPD87275.1 cytochrome c [Neisseria weixii]RPD88933.1 cytochrome c [Neisseria weixii]